MYSDTLTTTMNAAKVFSALVASRHSVRNFMPQPVPADIIQRALNDARLSPSNANTQPWVVHIVSGEARQRLAEALKGAVMQRQFSPDFSYANADYTGAWAQRAQQQGEQYHQAQGVARDDQQARMALALKNYDFFDAPHVALLFLPLVGDGVRAAADVGMFAQSLLLSLTASGVSAVPQTSIGMMANTVREVLGVADDLKLLFAISFGYAAEGEPRGDHSSKIGLDELVTFHQ